MRLGERSETIVPVSLCRAYMKVAETLGRDIGKKSKLRMLNIFQYAIIFIYFTFCLTAIVNILYLTIKISKESKIYFCSQNLY